MKQRWMRLTALYAAEILSALSRRQSLRLVTALVHFPRWKRTQMRGSPLADASPWITFDAQRRLAQVLSHTTRAFEFGSGGSTLFLAERVRELISVEHDPEWWATVTERLASLGYTNVTLELHPPAVEKDMANYTSTGAQYQGVSFRDFAASIDRFPDGYFDLVLIDGRARVACFRHASPKLREGGFMILDNSERGEYEEILQGAAAWGWTPSHHFGPGPYVGPFWRTTIWTKTGGPRSLGARAERSHVKADVPSRSSQLILGTQGPRRRFIFEVALG